MDRRCPSAVVGALIVGARPLRSRMPRKRRDRRGDPLMGSVQRVRGDAAARSAARRSPRTTRRRSARSRSASTAATSSTATRTAWRSASAASSAPACARRKCIYVRGADNPPDAPVSPGERYGFVYEINYLRCIHCDLCVEACPTEAITETKLFEFSFTNRERRDLHQGRAARRRRRPRPPPAVGAVARRRGRRHQRVDARDRAVGQAVYEGRVGWSGELGFGVRAPEAGQSADRARARSRSRHRQSRSATSTPTAQRRPHAGGH